MIVLRTNNTHKLTAKYSRNMSEDTMFKEKIKNLKRVAWNDVDRSI